MLQAIIKRSSTTTSSSARGTVNRAEKPMHKSPIFEGALSRTFTIFSGLVENLLGSPQKILPPSPPPRNTKKRHVFQIQTFSSISKISRLLKKLFLDTLTSTLSAWKRTKKNSQKCDQEKYFSNVFQFWNKIPLYVKSMKMRLYISSGGSFKQLWKSDSMMWGQAWGIFLFWTRWIPIRIYSTQK